MIGTEASGGGAGRALHRAASALIDRGHDVDTLHLAGSRITSNSILIERAAANPEDELCDDALRRFERGYIAERRSALSDTLFTSETCGYDLAALPFLRDYDIINIHWTSFFLSAENIGAIIALGRPVAFTLHDMVYFTGGCHYSAGCVGYRNDCTDCPQLTPDILNIAPKTRALKQKLFSKPNVAVIAPSAWLTRCAAESAVFAGLPCHQISNPIETDIFRPLDRARARESLGLLPDDRAILFGAYNGKERRKGFRHMLAALETFREDARVREGRAQNKLKILTFGAPPEELARTKMSVLSLGFIDDDEALARIYNAADVLVLPSIEDNQPNVMLESLACGTPVVCFNIGGQPDLVRDGVTGFAVAPFDTRAMAARIGDVLFDSARGNFMRSAAPALVWRTASPAVVGQELERVFRQLAASVNSPRADVPALMPGINADGVRTAEARVAYASGLQELARDLPPVIVPEPLPPPPPPQLPEPTLEETFVAFLETRDRLLGQLRAAPQGQMRTAFRLSRGGTGRRGGFAALALPIIRSYHFNWTTLAGMGRRTGSYGASALRTLGRTIGIGKCTD